MSIFDWIGDILNLVPQSNQPQRNDIQLAHDLNQQNIDFQRETNAANWTQQQQINDQNNAFNLDMFNRGVAVQQDAAQNGIQWRIQDAARAGIHPLYAMGGATPSIMPPTVMGASQGSPGVAPRGDFSPSGSSSPKRDFSGFGQNIGRAIESMLTKEERAAAKVAAAKQAAINDQRSVLGLENMSLENDLLRSQIARNNQVNPPAPSFKPSNDFGPVGKGEGKRVEMFPAQNTLSSPTNSAREAGAISDYGFYHLPGGGLGITYSRDMKTRTEDDLPQQIQWSIRNQFLPFMGGLNPPSSKSWPLPKGYDKWRWSALRQGFFPYNTRTKQFLPKD